MSFHQFVAEPAASASAALAKIAPAASVSGASLAGAVLPWFVYVLTAVYTAAQLFFLLRDKWWRERNPK